MAIRRIVSLTLAAALAVSAPAIAQTLTPDQKALATYKLTMPTVRKVAAVMQKFNAMAEQDPKAQELKKVRAEIEALNQKDELTEAEQARLEKLQEREEALDREIEAAEGPGNADTIADLAARVDARPEAKAALAAEGLTSREFAMTFMALLQAAMIKGFSQGKVDLAKLPPGVNPDNIRFVEENEKELAALQAAMGGAPKK